MRDLDLDKCMLQSMKVLQRNSSSGMQADISHYRPP